MEKPRPSPRPTTRSPASKQRSKADTIIRPARSPAVGGPSFHFVGGKGGVGKTTCAAALAVVAAEAGSRVLVASTDPAPSLADALAVPLSSAPRRVPVRRGQLYAAELDAARSLRRWIDARRTTLEHIALQGTWLDAEDVARLLRLTLPGVDELAALFEIARLATGTRFDLIVVDTAPTGHTLRLFSLPHTLAAVAELFDHMRDKHRIVEQMLRGAWTRGAEDAVIAELASSAADLVSLLRDRGRTRMTWVTLPEPMALAETEDALRSLAGAGIHVDTLVANRVTPAPDTSCGHCEARRAAERVVLTAVPAGLDRRYVWARAVEPRGVSMLRSIGSELHGAKPPVLGPKRARAWVASLSGRSVAPWMLVSETTRLVLLGGKGGVGKTTCAAALAISLARRWKERPVLLISVDPAHSLGDVLGQPVADAATLMAGGPSNLHVRELDAGLALRQFQARLSGGVDRLFDAADRSVVRGLIELAPPGLDELAAVLRINDGMLREAASGQLIVIDTAPSGHALRLLEMPALVQDWARALMSILLKYQGVVPLGEAGAALLDLSQAIGRLRTLLRSPELASFIAVTRPAALPRLETTRLLKQLRRLHLHVPWVIVNAVGRGSCRHCLRHARTQQTELKQIVRPSSERAHGVVVTPAQSPSPRGVAALGRWSSRWIDPPAGASRTPATLRYHRSR